ncbi:hypothetical protein Tco_1064821, partial [Tanacetum coccineum]
FVGGLKNDLETLVHQQAVASQSQYEALRSELRETLRSELQETLRSELQAACGLLQTRHGGEGDQGVLLPRSMRLDVPKFEESVKNRFGPSKYENPQGALSKLLQLGTVEKYQREFEKLMNRVTHIPKTLLISFYVSGLKLHIQRELLVSRPVSLGDAFELARITEARLEDQTASTTGTITKPATSVGTQKPVVPRLGGPSTPVSMAKSVVAKAYGDF